MLRLVLHWFFFVWSVCVCVFECIIVCIFELISNNVFCVSVFVYLFCVWKLNWIFVILHIWFAVCTKFKWFTWLDGNDSDKCPGLNEATYWWRCAGDIDAGAYQQCACVCIWPVVSGERQCYFVVICHFCNFDFSAYFEFKSEVLCFTLLLFNSYPKKTFKKPDVPPNCNIELFSFCSAKNLYLYKAQIHTFCVCISIK